MSKYIQLALLATLVTGTAAIAKSVTISCPTKQQFDDNNNYINLDNGGHFKKTPKTSVTGPTASLVGPDNDGSYAVVCAYLDASGSPKTLTSTSANGDYHGKLYQCTQTSVEGSFDCSTTNTPSANKMRK